MQPKVTPQLWGAMKCHPNVSVLNLLFVVFFCLICDCSEARNVITLFYGLICERFLDKDMITLSFMV